MIKIGVCAPKFGAFLEAFIVFVDLFARIPALLLGCGFSNVLDIVDAVYIQ